MEGGEAKVIPNQEGNRLTPSVVAFTDKGESSSASRPRVRRSRIPPEEHVYSIKRFMGRRHSEVESEEKMVPYKVVGGPNDYVKVDIKVGDKSTRRRKSRRRCCASSRSGRGVPRPQGEQGGHHRPGLLQRRPAAGDQRRRSNRRPGSRRIINEPTAAALAYGLDKKRTTRRSSSSISAAVRSTCRCSKSLTACSA
jgi:molecular chaperone DnaK